MPITLKNSGGSGNVKFINNNTGGASSIKTTPPPTYSIGQSTLGGIVGYILQSGDSGYDANNQHGLIVSTTDLSTASEWATGSYLVVTGATGTAIGTGLSNTTAIVSSIIAAGRPAATLCVNHNGGGYTDWYLPSRDELNALYTNRVAIGGFASAYYWTSTETDFRTAYVQNLTTSGGFPAGYQTSFFKYNTYYVRAVRTF